jgi:2-hydroxyglutarate dehydrogenase
MVTFQDWGPLKSHLSIFQALATRKSYMRVSSSSPSKYTIGGPSILCFTGLYYPPDSLKTQLCLRGRHLLYDRCAAYTIPFRKTGKLVVAQEHQLEYIKSLHSKVQQLQWPAFHTPKEGPALPVELISGDKARQLEPDLSQSIVAALWSPETGIIDSHSLIESLEKDIMDSPESALVYSTRVVRVDPYKPNAGHNGEGWVVQTVTGDAQQSDALLARNLINSSGLSGNMILNSMLPPEDRIPMYYARGSYASYSGPGVSNVSRLIYPCPETKGARKGDSTSFVGLGTHLTLDLNGKIKFGPDVAWISPAEGAKEEDFWKHHLVPDESRINTMHQAITEYLPNVELSGLAPDYVGIRPKLIPPQGGFQDFVFKAHYPGHFLRDGGGKNDGTSPMITILGIESPGLTSSLAIAEMVVDRILLR